MRSLWGRPATMRRPPRARRAPRAAERRGAGRGRGQGEQELSEAALAALDEPAGVPRAEDDGGSSGGAGGAADEMDRYEAVMVAAGEVHPRPRPRRPC